MHITNPANILIKNNAFRGVFLIGLISVFTSLILSIILASSGNYCANMNYCVNNHYNDYPISCIDYSELYCCGYGTGYSSCGSYYKSCVWIGSNYSDCNALITVQYVMGAIALLCLIAMMVIARKHRQRQQTLAMGNYMRQNQNVIFTDRVPNNMVQPQLPHQPQHQPQQPQQSHQPQQPQQPRQPQQNQHPQPQQQPNPYYDINRSVNERADLQ